MPTIFQAATKSNTTKQSKATTGSQAHIPMKPLTAFVKYPDGVRFETQEAQEEVVLFLRQHPIVNIGWILLAVLLLVSPTIVIPIVVGVLHLHIIVPTGYLIIGTLFWYLMTFGFILANFISWFFNIYIVTNQRVIDIDFLYLLYKQFSEAELTKIQDISYTAGGLAATVFDFGNVSIETAGEAPNLLFEKIPHPEQVVEAIRSLTEGSGGTV